MAERVEGLKIHAMVARDLDDHHEAALKVPLSRVTDENLLTEVARRKLEIHSEITMVRIKLLPSPVNHTADFLQTCMQLREHIEYN